MKVDDLRPYCFPCRSNVRGSMAVHLTTKRHRNSGRPKVQRRSRLGYRIRDGATPSWVLIGRANGWDPLPDEAYLDGSVSTDLS